MGAVISVIDWCLDRKAHHNKSKELENTISDYEDNIKEVTTSTSDCVLNCCKQKR